jgi:hypothetical protein
MHLPHRIAIQLNLELKTWPNQHLGDLALVIALPARVDVILIVVYVLCLEQVHTPGDNVLVLYKWHWKPTCLTS